MKNTVENEKSPEDLLETILKLKKELNESYLILKSSFNPVKNIDILNNKNKALKEITEKLKEFKVYDDTNIKNGNEGLEPFKERIKAEISEIAFINNAFFGLIKKNIHYNQLTISFIADAFNKNSIYNKTGGNNPNFFPLKNILIGSGVRI